MRVRADRAGKALTQLVKGLKFAINVQVVPLQMGPKELKNVLRAHGVILLKSVHQLVSPALRVVSPPTHQAIVSHVHQELTTL